MAEILDYQATKVADLPTGVVTVKVSAPWCGPCKSLAKTFINLQNSVLAEVNADGESEFIDTFKIRSIPTTLVFKDGELQNKIVGDSPGLIQKAIDELI